MKSKILIIISIFFVSALLLAWRNTENKKNKIYSQNNNDSFFETVGTPGTNNPDEIKIGTQTWASKNLDVNTFKNGEPIPEAKTIEEWKIAGKNKKPAWCYYENDNGSGKIFGKLYNWYAVGDPRGLAPKGWHIPVNADWVKLTDYLGGESAASTKLKSTYGWIVDKELVNPEKSVLKSSINNTGQQTDKSSEEINFTALPGGSRDTEGLFHGVGYYGCWWSATEGSSFNGWDRIMSCNEAHVYSNTTSKVCGFSVRCIKD